MGARVARSCVPGARTCPAVGTSGLSSPALQTGSVLPTRPGTSDATSCSDTHGVSSPPSCSGRPHPDVWACWVRRNSTSDREGPSSEPPRLHGSCPSHHVHELDRTTVYQHPASPGPPSAGGSVRKRYSCGQGRWHSPCSLSTWDLRACAHPQALACDPCRARREDTRVCRSAQQQLDQPRSNA